MQVITLLNNNLQFVISFFQRQNVERIFIRILMWVFIINIIFATGLYIKFFKPFTSTVVSAAVTNTSEISKSLNSTNTGTTTKDFVAYLGVNGLMPIVVSDISRNQFRVTGKIITVNGDNIQVYEYPNREMAAADISILEKKYAASSRSIEYKKNIHVYNRANLAIFYMGTNKAIIKTLNNISLSSFALQK